MILDFERRGRFVLAVAVTERGTVVQGVRFGQVMEGGLARNVAVGGAGEGSSQEEGDRLGGGSVLGGVVEEAAGGGVLGGERQ